MKDERAPALLESVVALRELIFISGAGEGGKASFS